MYAYLHTCIHTLHISIPTCACTIACQIQIHIQMQIQVQMQIQLQIHAPMYALPIHVPICTCIHARPAVSEAILIEDDAESVHTAVDPLSPAPAPASPPASAVFSPASLAPASPASVVWSPPPLAPSSQIFSPSPSVVAEFVAPPPLPASLFPPPPPPLVDPGIPPRPVQDGPEHRPWNVDATQGLFVPWVNAGAPPLVPRVQQSPARSRSPRRFMGKIVTLPNPGDWLPASQGGFM